MDKTAVGLLAVIGGGLALWLYPYWTAWQKEPDRWVDAVSAGVDINSAVLTVDEHTDYAYSFSPLDASLALERRYRDFDDAAIRAVADQIAEEVSWKVLIAGKESHIADAERALWEAGRGGEVMEHIAEGLRHAHIIYGEESLYSRGFDPDANRGNFAHLDCDLIAHVFLHVARALDLNVAEMNSPLHVYLRYSPPDGVDSAPLYIEPTAFRSTIDRGSHVDLRGQSLGEGFFIRRTQHENSARSVQATAAMIEAAGFYTPATDKDVRDGILASVNAGMSSHFEDDTAARDALLAEMAAAAPGSREPHLITNLYLGQLRRGERAVEEGDGALALAMADALEGLEASHPALLIYRGEFAAVLRMKGLHASGDEAGAAEIRQRLFSEVYTRLYEEADGTPYPYDELHADLLWYALQATKRRRVGEYNDLILPLMNYEHARSVRTRDEARLRALYGEAARALSHLNPVLAGQYRQRAAGEGL